MNVAGNSLVMPPAYSPWVRSATQGKAAHTDHSRVCMYAQTCVHLPSRWAWAARFWADFIDVCGPHFEVRHIHLDDVSTPQAALDMARTELRVRP